MRVKGYLSVEAALIFPVVIMVVMMMMGMSIYTYDRCIIKACTYDALLVGADEEIEGNLDRKTKMKERLSQTIDERGISLSEININTEDGLLKVKVSVDAKVNLLWITSTDLPVHYERELVKLDTVKTMRLLNFGKKAVNKGE